jgi:hypothetical protein
MALFEDKCKIYVPRLMQDLSITREQACGIFGNLGGETGGFTALQEKNPTVKGSRGGYGWMQWTGPRRKKYEAWCKQNNLNAATDEANYRYLVQETKTDELHSLLQLRKTSTVEAATETFMLQNLRPGVPNLKGRINWAKRADDATKVLKQEQKKQDQQTGATATTVSVGAVLLYSFQEHWLAIVSGMAVIGGMAWLMIHEHHERQKEEIMRQQAASKKGKK